MATHRHHKKPVRFHKRQAALVETERLDRHGIPFLEKLISPSEFAYQHQGGSRFGVPYRKLLNDVTIVVCPGKYPAFRGRS